VTRRTRVALLASILLVLVVLVLVAYQQ